MALKIYSPYSIEKILTRALIAAKQLDAPRALARSG